MPSMGEWGEANTDDVFSVNRWTEAYINPLP